MRLVYRPTDKFLTFVGRTPAQYQSTYLHVTNPSTVTRDNVLVFINTEAVCPEALCTYIPTKACFASLPGVEKKRGTEK